MLTRINTFIEQATGIFPFFSCILQADLGVHTDGQSFSFVGKTVVETPVLARLIDQEIHAFLVRIFGWLAIWLGLGVPAGSISEGHDGISL